MQSSAFPAVPARVPKRGNPTSCKFWQQAFLAHGWQIKGSIPNIAKALVIGAPHTSNLDGWYALMGIMGLGLDITIMAKDSLFKPPFQGLLNWLNVMPVNRSSASGLVDQVKARFDQHKAIWIGIAPEGTRSGAQQWKSGFYHMAMSANVPIIMVGLDYAARQIIFLGVFYPTGNYQDDLEKIIAHYGGLVPYHPDKLSHPLRGL